MSLGLGIVLFVIGAILAFALNLTVDWINLQLVGYILMIAGVIVIILGIVLLARRRRSISTSQTSVDPATGSRVTRNEHSAPEDPTVL
jgi:cytochrome c biogenesis protein CcdA